MLGALVQMVGRAMEIELPSDAQLQRVTLLDNHVSIDLTQCYKTSPTTWYIPAHLIENQLSNMRAIADTHVAVLFVKPGSWGRTVTRLSPDGIAILEETLVGDGEYSDFTDGDCRDSNDGECCGS